MTLAPDTDELADRLTRMKRLVDELERVCSDSAEQRQAIEKLRAEIDAARLALRLHISLPD